MLRSIYILTSIILISFTKITPLQINFQACVKITKILLFHTIKYLIFVILSLPRILQYNFLETYFSKYQHLWSLDKTVFGEDNPCVRPPPPKYNFKTTSNLWKFHGVLFLSLFSFDVVLFVSVR